MLVSVQALRSLSARGTIVRARGHVSLLILHICAQLVPIALLGRPRLIHSRAQPDIIALLARPARQPIHVRPDIIAYPEVRRIL